MNSTKRLVIHTQEKVRVGHERLYLVSGTYKGEAFQAGEVRGARRSWEIAGKVNAPAVSRALSKAIWTNL